MGFLAQLIFICIYMYIYKDIYSDLFSSLLFSSRPFSSLISYHASLSHVLALCLSLSLSIIPLSLSLIPLSLSLSSHSLSLSLGLASRKRQIVPLRLAQQLAETCLAHRTAGASSHFIGNMAPAGLPAATEPKASSEREPPTSTHFPLAFGLR